MKLYNTRENYDPLTDEVDGLEISEPYAIESPPENLSREMMDREKRG